MKGELIPAVAKDVIESGRITVHNVIGTYDGGVERVLGVCDGAWKLGADVLAKDHGLISPKLKSDLIAAQSEITGIAGSMVAGVARGAGKATDFVADTAANAVGQFEEVFDSRVMRSLNRLGMPAAQVIRELGDRVAFLSQELNKLVAGKPEQAARPARSASRRKKPVLKAVA